VAAKRTAVVFATEGYIVGKAEPGVSKWRKSSFSGTGNCVEVQRDGAFVRVRDSKDPYGTCLSFTRDEWAVFLAGAASGEFEWTALS
jgi:hypothetical protein